MRHMAFVLALAGALPLLVRAQQAPTFRGGTELVAVDFLATTSNGTPVGDLTKSDLTLTVDGKPRAIDSMEFLRADGGGARGTNWRLPDAGAITVAGRRFVIVVNHESFGPGQERQTRDAAERFVGRLTPNDEVAVVTLPHGRTESDFSRNRAQTTAALRRITGHAPAPKDVECADTKSLRIFMDGLRLDTIASIVLISDEISNYATQPRCRIDFDDLVRMANTRRVRVFAVRPMPAQNMADTRSAVPSTASSLELPGLGALANLTGGKFFAPSARADAVFDEIDRATSAYYLLGFEPADKERNGKFHKIGLTSAREGVEIRARAEFRISK